MTKQSLLFGLIGLSFVQAGLMGLAHASSDYSSYDDIVRELQGSEISASVESSGTSFDSVRIHAGTGLVSSRLNLKTPGGVPSSASLNGYEVFLGIDLFSRNWIAEGAARSYSSEDFAQTNITLREFDLKVVYKDFFSKSAYWRGGAGMGARYLSFDNTPTGLKDDSYTTPSSIFVLGIGTQFNSNLSLGADFNYRTALITDTIEKNALDGNLRLTGTF